MYVLLQAIGDEIKFHAGLISMDLETVQVLSFGLFLNAYSF